MKLHQIKLYLKCRVTYLFGILVVSIVPYIMTAGMVPKMYFKIPIFHRQLQILEFS